ncbi:MAG: hypothetical protein HGA87_00400 [Desulfobulbaceae bacterium]|nr:hypothetical protein [Desulfobulbaceae bacterium]
MTTTGGADIAPYQPQQAPQPYREERTISLSDAQIAILTAPIPPHELAITGDGKVHVPFTTITARFNSAFGVAKWRLEDSKAIAHGNPQVIKTAAKHTIKDYTTKPPTEREEVGEKTEIILFQDLIVQGIVVASVQDGAEYFSWNKDGKYSNAMASAKSKCLYEAAKALGIGNEIKDKDYCAEWIQTYAVKDGNVWKKKRGEGVTIDQVRRLFWLIKDDHMTLNKVLPTLIGRIFTGPEMEEFLRQLTDRQRERNKLFHEMDEATAAESMERWTAAGLPKSSVGKLVVGETTITDAENFFLAEIEGLNQMEKLRSVKHDLSHLYADNPEKAEEEDPDKEGDCIPDDAPGLLKAGAKTYSEYPSDTLSKWYGEKPDKPVLLARYHSAMAIKLARLTGERYADVMALEFGEIVKQYSAAKAAKS